MGSFKYRIRDFAIKDSLAVDLARQDLECKASECFIVRTRLKRVSNEAVRCNAFVCKEEVQRFLHWYIQFVKSLDGHALQQNCEICGAFRVHFHDCFACCPDLPVQEFHSYFANFPYLGEAEVAICEGFVTECEVHDALKQVGPRSVEDGLPYELYLRMLYMFVPILTDMFNHWFAQVAIPDSITKGVIRLLKKGGRHVWEDLDDYRLITLLNTELKILA